MENYEILGIGKNASESDIKRAYRYLAKKYHPDLNKDSDAKDRFMEIQKAYEEMQREADRICSLIVVSDYAAIDVVIEIRKMREFAEAHFPDKMDLFKRIYESRFRRLWEQFRRGAEEPLPQW